MSVTTPNNTHFAIAKAALEAGLHVICEKPLCFTAAEANELLALSRRQNKIVGVTYGYAGYQMVQQARQMIAEGLLGQIRVITMQFAHGFHNEAVELQAESTRWRVTPGVCGPELRAGRSRNASAVYRRNYGAADQH
nr:Oxidoreductase [Raoultella sp. NCTC 9187]